MSADPGIEVRRAIALLKSSEMIMGSRDRAFDRLVKDALVHLESAKVGLGVGPAPAALPSELEPSIIEWIYGAADAGLATANAMEESARGPSQAEVLAGALLSIREWAARLLQKPGQGGYAPPSGRAAASGSISTPGGLR